MMKYCKMGGKIKFTDLDVPRSFDHEKTMQI